MEQMRLGERLQTVEAAIAGGHPEQALAHCQELLAIYPRALAVQRALGEIYLALRQPREALGALDRALAGNPEDARACCARAVIHQMHGDPLAALSWYRRACDLRPDDPTVRATYQELATHLRQPPYQPTRAGLARLYLRGALYPHAIREWESLIAENPDLLEAQVGLAETFWRARRLREAAERSQRIVVNTPSCVKPLLILAALAHDAGRDDEAQRILQRAAELDPDQRIGQALFADRLAAGDSALQALLFGGTPAASYLAPTGILPPGAAQQAPAREHPRRSVSRPLVQSQPLREETRSAYYDNQALWLCGSKSQPLREETRSAYPRRDVAALAEQETARLAASSLPLAAQAQQAPGGSANATASQNLPPNFHDIFSETEYMIWGPDAESGEQSARNVTASAPNASSASAPFEYTRAEPFARSTQFLPPALIEHGSNMEDTEARAALNWVHWLQAQGARIREGAVPPQRHGAPPSTPLFPSERPAAAETQSAPWSPPTSPLPTGPLPPQPVGPPPLATPEALRTMFAELDPATSTRRIVEADVAPATPRDEAPTPAAERAGDDTEAYSAAALAEAFAAMPEPEPEPVGAEPPLSMPAEEATYTPSFAETPGTNEARPLPDETDGWDLTRAEPEPELEPHEATPEPRWSEAEASEAGWIAEADLPAARDNASWSEDVSAEATSPVPALPVLTPDGAAASASETPALTLEALEEQLAHSGFQPFEPAPGMLATMAEGAARGLGDTPEMLDSGASHAIAPEASSATARENPEHPAEHDYPARLAFAREQRASGNLESALGEYHVLLRNAPDLLPDILADVQQSLDAHPERHELHRLLGDARLRQGDYLGALEAYNRAMALSQTHES